MVEETRERIQNRNQNETVEGVQAVTNPMRTIMSKPIRVKIPVPLSDTSYRIEVWHSDKLNRVGGVGAGITVANVKLPAPLEECTIQIIPCDSMNNPVGRGFTYQSEDESLAPTPPENTEPPVEPEIGVEEFDENVTLKPGDKVLEYKVDDEGQLDSVEDITEAVITRQKETKEDKISVDSSTEVKLNRLYPGKCDPPYFIEPPSDPLTASTDLQEKLKEEFPFHTEKKDSQETEEDN